MARNSNTLTFLCLFRILILLANLDSNYVSAHPYLTRSLSQNCTVNKHPDVSDLLNTTYINNVRTATLHSPNRTYRYVHFQPTPRGNRPTILFLHGFPSSSFDWRYQFDYFASRGYGIVAPDLLGYGGTDKPSDPAAYTLKRQAAEIVELLGCATGGGRAVVVAHDLGSPVLSRIADYFPSRFEKYVFLDIGYSAPGQLTTEAFVKANQDVFGYQIFFNEDGSGALLDQHQDSLWSIAYTADEPRYWTVDFSPAGALEVFLKANARVPTGAWLSAQDENIHNRIFASSRGGYEPTLNHYRAIYRNLNLADDNAIPPSAFNLTRPALLITASKDPIGTPGLAEGSTRPYAPDLRVHEIESGHFLMLEKAEEVNEAMREFFEE